MEWDELIRIWIIVCPLVFLGGLIDAVAGGGGLITLPAYLLAGLPPHLASGTNKCGNFFGTLIATGRFLKRGDVHLPSALAGGAGALVGAWLGARLNMIMPEQALYYLMLAVVPVMAVFLLFKRDFGTEDRSGELGVGKLVPLSLAIGLVIGCYDGFFGPGAGTFLTLAFTGLCRFDLLTACGQYQGGQRHLQPGQPGDLRPGGRRCCGRWASPPPCSALRGAMWGPGWP